MNPQIESRQRSSRSRGFSLLELLIVVGIILIIAMIAVPSLLRSRQAANESAAAASLKSINVAQNVYLMTTHEYGSMQALIADGLLDNRFQGELAGYTFSVELGGGSLDYTASAIATSENSGRYDYYSTPDYVIRYSTTESRAPAGLAGDPVQ